MLEQTDASNISLLLKGRAIYVAMMVDKQSYERTPFLRSSSPIPLSEEVLVCLHSLLGTITHKEASHMLNFIGLAQWSNKVRALRRHRNYEAHRFTADMLCKIVTSSPPSGKVVAMGTPDKSQHPSNRSPCLHKKAVAMSAMMVPRMV